jgi:hypothetical protein
MALNGLLYSKKPSDGFRRHETRKQDVVRSLKKRHTLVLCLDPPLLPCVQDPIDGLRTRPGYLRGSEPMALGFSLQQPFIGNILPLDSQ